MRASREGKLAHFYQHFRDGMTVLDAGVSIASPESSPTNYFLKHFRYDPKHYTGLTVDDPSGLRQQHPAMAFVQYPGGRFPFADRQFDWVFSNAVIEHVGSRQAQLIFLNEMLRVGANVFFTTTNKYFPVESHTLALFLHWNSTVFYWWCKRTAQGYTRENLDLFSYRRLKGLVASSNASTYKLYKNRVLGLPMTFTAICTSGPY
jgi:methyltransferase family protein